MRANPQVSDLRLDDAHLETLNQYFLSLRAKLGFRARVYVETQPVRLPWWPGGRLRRVRRHLNSLRRDHGSTFEHGSQKC